jgi:DNA-directed RNA polymerase specialized sigma24 family protein
MRPNQNFRFGTTRWGLVIQAGGSSAGAESALAELCEGYWYPVYAFIRRTGAPTEDAKDLTQAFFARVLEKGALKYADPDRGRFRSFLLASVRHFLSNEQDSRQAMKRGGGQVIVSLTIEDGEHQYRREPVDGLTPDRIYERRWALAVLDGALNRVGTKYAASGRQELFSRLAGTLTGDDPVVYASLAHDLKTTEGALRVAIHRMRKDFGTALRTTIAETVEHPQDVDDELRYLLTAIER